MTTEAARHAPPAAPQQMMQMIMGFWVAQCVGTLAKLGVPDAMATCPATATQVAQAVGAHPEGMRRLLRACAGLGLVSESADPEPRYGLTELSGLLQDTPGSLRDMARMMALPAHWNSWGLLDEAVKTNARTFAKATGAEDLFAYLNGVPAEAEAFNGAMTGLTAQSAPALAEGYDWSRFGTIADIGGGHGALLAALLGAAPATKGFVYDLPVVVDNRPAGNPLAALGDRAGFQAGDFFASIPAGADAYVMKHILHDWDDAKAIAILENIRQAIGPAGTLVVIEMVVAEVPGFDLAKMMDLNMMVMCDGKERTRSEWAALFAEGGFKLDDVIPTPSPYSLVVGSPV